MPGHPFTLHQTLERLLLVLGATIIDDNIAQFLNARRFNRPEFGVHFVGGEAEVWIENERCGQIVVFGELFGCHSDVLGFGGGVMVGAGGGALVGRR